MYNRLYEGVIKSKVLYEKQFGFQAARSAEHAILELLNCISKFFENGKFTLGVFINFSEAFGTVDHTILLNNKFNKYDIT